MAGAGVTDKQKAVVTGGPVGEELRQPRSLRGGTRGPLLAEGDASPGSSQGTESARVHSMTTGPRKQNPQQMLALHFEHKLLSLSKARRPTGDLRGEYKRPSETSENQVAA